MNSSDNPLNLPKQSKQTGSGEMPDNQLSIQHKKPQVLVTSASSFIGEHLIAELSAGKQEVLALFQGYEPRALARVIPVRTQYRNKNFLLSQLKAVRSVVCLDWCFPESKSLTEQDIFEQSKNLIEAAEKTGLKRFVLFSTLNEKTKAEAQINDFANKMYQAELLLLNSQIEEKVIIRIPPVFSSKASEIFDAPLSASILDLMRFPVFYPLLGLKETVSPIDMQDLQTIAFRAVQFPMVEKTILIKIQTNNPVSKQRLFELIAAKAGLKYRFAVSGLFGQWLQKLILKLIGNRVDLSFLAHFEQINKDSELIAGKEGRDSLNQEDQLDVFQSKVLLPFFRSVEVGLQSKTIDKQRVKGRTLWAAFKAK